MTSLPGFPVFLDTLCSAFVFTSNLGATLRNAELGSYISATEPERFYKYAYICTRRLCQRRLAGAPSSGFSISVQPTTPASPIGLLREQYKKLMNFMYFHNSCTRNRNHHIHLNMTSNAHKESCHKLSLILVREKGLKHDQN